MTNEKELLIQKMHQESLMPIPSDILSTFHTYHAHIDAGNPDEVSHLLFYKGIHCFRTGDFIQSLDYFSRYIHAPKSKELKKNDAISYNFMGLIHSYLKQEVIAKDNFSKCIRLCQRYHFKEPLITAYIYLGFLYFTLDNYIKAIEHEEMAYSLIDKEDEGFFQLLLICLGYQGVIHFKFGQEEKAADIYRQIKRLQTSHNHYFFTASIRNLAIRISCCKQDEEGMQEHISQLLAAQITPEEFLLSFESYFDICDFMLKAGKQTETRQLIDYVSSYAKDFPQEFLRFYVQRLEAAYAKQFCSEDAYLNAVTMLLEQLPRYEEEQLAAQNYSLEHIAYIHQTKSLSSQYEEMSKLDPMTSLLNKYTIQFLIEEYLDDMDSNDIAAILIIDMDHFKQLNDTFGHLTGDAILTDTAALIQRHFHTDCFCGRVGGDEFLVFIKHVEDTDAVYLQTELLREKIYKTVTERNISITTQVSIGISFTSDKRCTYESLFAAADNALYQAKKEGRNKTVVYQ